MRLQGDPLDKLEQCPIYNSTLEPFISPKYVDSNAFLLTQKVFNSVNFSINYFRRETKNNGQQFDKQIHG